MTSQALLLQRTRAFTIALLVFPVVSASHGASFDCTKAATLVENAICSDPQLSALDDTLATAYRQALDDAAAADEIKGSQRSWIKKRNTCQDAACLKKVRLSEVGKQRVMDSSRPCYTRQGCRYSAGSVTADVTYRQSGDDYDVTIKLEQGARRQRIQGKAVCGC